MRFLAAVLSMIALAWASEAQGAAAAPEAAPSVLAPYQQDIGGLGVIARLQGRDITAKDALAEFHPTSDSMLGQPGTDRARQALMEMAMAAVREDALEALVLVFSPDCSTKATPEDVTAYYRFWRALISQEQARSKSAGERETGVSWELSLEALAKVDQSTPGAEWVARWSVHQWRLYHCVQARYGSEVFTAAPKVFEGGLRLDRPPGSGALLREPDSNALTPSGSIRRMFQEAEKAGLLSLPSPSDQEAFYRAYRPNSRFGRCFNDVETASAYFATPPWSSTGFPPRERPASTFRLPSASTPALLVDPPAGWTVCRYDPGGLFVASSDESLILEFMIISDAPANRNDFDNFAANFISGVGFPPASQTEAAAIAGTSGTAYISSRSDSGETFTLRVVLARLDAAHVVSEAIVEPSHLNNEQEQVLAKALGSARLVTK